MDRFVRGDLPRIRDALALPGTHERGGNNYVGFVRDIMGSSGTAALSVVRR